MYPTPKALAIASARRGFSSRAPGAGAASIFAVIMFFQIKDDGVAAALDDFFFIENRIGDDVLFAGPIAQVALPAALAAKGKVRMNRGVRLNFTDGAFVKLRRTPRFMRTFPFAA